MTHHDDPQDHRVSTRMDEQGHFICQCTDAAWENLMRILASAGVDTSDTPFRRADGEVRRDD